LALAISGGALQVGGNQTGSFTLKGGPDKATTLATLQQGRCENVVTNTTEISDQFITSRAFSNVA